LRFKANKEFAKPYLEKNLSQKRKGAGRVIQDIGPEVKLQYTLPNNNKKET
jgi:hypothetical protein